MTEFKILASNIKCNGCATNIINGLNELTGIDSVEVNIEAGEVTVSANDISQSEIELKLSDLGYPAKK